MRILLITLFSIISLETYGQRQLYNIIIDEKANGKTIRQITSELERAFGVDFIFENNKRLDHKVQNLRGRSPLLYALETQLKECKIRTYNQKIVLITEKEDARSSSDISVIILPEDQQAVTCRIFDLESTEPLIGANIKIGDAGGDISNEQGYISTNLNDKITKYTVSYIGYTPSIFYIIKSESQRDKKTIVDFPVAKDFNQLGTIDIIGTKKDANVSKTNSAVQQLSINTIKKLPSLMGDIDPIKGVATLPGVNSNGDLASGFNVRGSQNSQNLILQDGATIFNPTHLFGFFSVFNPDFVSNVTLLKAGGDASHGGRIASVLKINNRNGDLNEYRLNGGVSPISTRISVEGPIRKNKTSFLIGGRQSYSSWMLKYFEDEDLRESRANFYDYSIKLFHSIDEKNYITGTAYLSHDDFTLGNNNTTYSWQTKNFSLKWDRTDKNDDIGSLTLARSKYKSSNLLEDQLLGFIRSNGVTMYTLDYSKNHTFSDKLKLIYGANINQYNINPGASTPSSTSSISTPIKLNEQKAVESAVFLSTDLTLTDRLSVECGLRYTHFTRYGEDKIFSVDYNQVKGRTPIITDTLHFVKNQVVSSYGGIEPRLSLNLGVTDQSAIKVGYTRSQQFINQVTTTLSPSPLDFVSLSSPNIKPQIGNQFTIGYFQNLSDNKVEASLEFFYKDVNNAIDYISGLDLNSNPVYESGLLQGDGESYGAEFLLKKKTGKLNGWISYTFLRSYLQFKSDISALAINEGQLYSSVYDIPHQLSVVSNYRLSKYVNLSANFTYTSGQPITIPTSKYTYGDILSVNTYSKRNEYRSPAYHRLDLSMTISGKKKPGKKFHNEWVISIFNMYNRQNVYSIFFNNSGVAYRTSVLGSIIPSITYNFKYN